MSLEQLEYRIQAWGFIEENDQNFKFYYNEDVLYTVVHDTFQLHQMLYEEECQIDHDVKSFLGRLMEKASSISEDQKEIITYCIENIGFDAAQNTTHALLSIHDLAIDLTQLVVKNEEDWLSFLRMLLPTHFSKNPEQFIYLSKYCFPQIFIHPRNIQVIRSILSDCAKKITYHLGALNDFFKECYLQANKNLTEALRRLDSMARFDQRPSLEGNVSRKSNLSFPFINDSGKEELIYCEAHFKLLYNDRNGSPSQDRRIYFHPGKDNIHSGQILVGHIGNHL
jgi:hypothetical protein